MLFVAYGIFVNDDTMYFLSEGITENLGQITVPDWQFQWRGCADIELSHGQSFDGLLWNIDQKTLKSLDRIEGYPNYYNRINVVTGHGSAFMYTMINKGKLSAPSEMMFDEIWEGYERNGLDTNQLFNALSHVR